MHMVNLFNLAVLAGTGRLRIAAREPQPNSGCRELHHKAQSAGRSVVITKIQCRLETSLSMKASLSIDRLVDLSLNYQYKIVTKKGYWHIPSSVEYLNKILHQHVRAVLESISRLIRGQTDRIWVYQQPTSRELYILSLFASDVTHSETRSTGLSIDRLAFIDRPASGLDSMPYGHIQISQIHVLLIIMCMSGWVDVPKAAAYGQQISRSGGATAPLITSMEPIPSSSSSHSFMRHWQQVALPAQAQRERLAEIASEVTRLVGLEQEGRALEDSLSRVIYPVLTLPNEITARIFVYCLPSHGEKPSPQKALLLLAQV
ncbi:hypothetical protein GGX14DRAFT_626469 [Mycena pura]|uniref:Uncharacterized protein n=1 Tax=Mycena pura TaxID=153505 RepID=A0AAD6YD63_9AGAR|nr:hypothetical protein GGX14DRAFT_626469 [Mycena pura]